MVTEYLGGYGEIHKINKDGTESKRSKKLIYCTDGDKPMVYCQSCGEAVDYDDFVRRK